MSTKNKYEDWENQLRNEVNLQTEPTSEAEFEEFMTELEDTGYFKKNKRRFLFWIFPVAISLGFTGYLLQTEEPQSVDNQEVEEVIEPQVEIEVVKTVPIIRAEPIVEEVVETKEVFVEKETPVIVLKELPVINVPITAPVIEPVIVEELTVEIEPKVVEPKSRVTTRIVISSDTTVVSDTSRVKKRHKRKRK